MDTQLINSNNLKEKLKNIGLEKKVSPNIQSWLDTTVHKHWSKRLPQENFTGFIDEPWFKEKSKDTQFKQLVLTPVFVSEVHHLIDFLKANYQFERNEEIIQKPLNKLNYLECERQANEWIKRLNKKISLEEDWDNLKLLSTINYEGQDYKLYELTSRQNLRREGKMMNNCISTYAEQPDKALEDIKFYSIRDTDNKSVVSMSLHKEINLEEIKKDIEKWNYPKEREEVLEEITLKHELFEITEIKEKNNEFLDEYRTITKLFLNQILKDKNYCVRHTADAYSNYSQVLDESELILLKNNQILEFENLNETNYEDVKVFSNTIVKKLGEEILKKDNSIALGLMKLTPWVNVTPLHQEKEIDINENLKELIINSPHLKKINIGLRSAQHEKQKININHSIDLELNIYDRNLAAHIFESKNITINYHIQKPTHMSHHMLLDSTIKQIKCTKGVLAKFLAIDSSIEDTGLYNKNNDIPKHEIISIDTRKGVIKSLNSNIENNISLIPFINNFHQENSFEAKSDKLEDFLYKKIKIKDIVIDDSIDKIEIDNTDPYHLTFKLPVYDKQNIVLAILDSKLFKTQMIDHTIDRLSIYESDFNEYLAIDCNMDKEIESAELEIKRINEKFKDDPNAINYRNPIKKLLGNFFQEEVISASHIHTLEKIRDMLIENFEGSRVNTSRTKLSKHTQKTLVDFLLAYSEKKAFSAQAEKELREIFNSSPQLKTIKYKC